MRRYLEKKSATLRERGGSPGKPIAPNDVYLPDSLYPEALVSEEDFEDFEAHMDYLSSPRCNMGRHIAPTIIEWGFGSSVNSLVKPTMHALKYGYCLKEPHGFMKYNCPSWKTLFLPISTPCNISVERTSLHYTALEDDSNCAEVFSRPTSFLKGGQPKLFFSKDYSNCAKMYSYSLNGEEILPKQHEIPFFFSVSFILRHLLRPSEDLQQQINEQKQKMNWPSKGTPILGLHYRAGDSCLEQEGDLGRKCDSFDKYMEFVDLLAPKYNITHVYLATDSAKVLKTLDQYPKYTFHYVDSIGRGGFRNNVPIDQLLYYGLLDGCKEAHDAMFDMHFLGQTDAFIGKFSSNIDRVAYNLQCGRTRTYQPRISLDNEWCFDFGVRSRIDAFHKKGEKLYC
uniref:Alpha-(1,6)-fucosyltransferase N- and catalytic domain-containing protein n=1 Tax=Amorphochlora amoebiformis TaxID=1561963 RepID=A0A7S0DHF0_9EUKA